MLSLTSVSWCTVQVFSKLVGTWSRKLYFLETDYLSKMCFVEQCVQSLNESLPVLTVISYGLLVGSL